MFELLREISSSTNFLNHSQSEYLKGYICFGHLPPNRISSTLLCGNRSGMDSPRVRNVPGSGTKLKPLSFRATVAGETGRSRSSRRFLGGYTASMLRLDPN